MANTPPVIPLNPFKAADTKHRKHHDRYTKAIAFVKKRNPQLRPRILVYTDIEQDYDDLLAVIFLAEMHRLGAIELAGFVANHHPARQRAEFLRTVLHLLGHPTIPVAVGTDGRQHPKDHPTDFYYGLKNKTFREAKWNKPKPGQKDEDVFQSGEKLIKTLAGQNKAPLTVLLISTLQDIGEFFDAQKKTDEGKAFLRNKFHKFVSQGGYTVKEEPAGESGSAGKAATQTKVVMEPTAGMMNNDFHIERAKSYTNGLAELGLPSDAWSRNAAKAARLPGTFMEGLFQYGPIGAHLQWLWKRQEFKFYWDPFHWPHRPFLGVPWYLNTRLGLDRKSQEFETLKTTGISFTDAAPMIKVIAYDCCAAVGAVGDDFMRVMGVLEEKDMPAYNKAKHGHRVFGKEPDDQGGINISKLVGVMETFLLGGLMATHNLPINKTDEFKTLTHEPVESPYDLNLFLTTMMPVMKVIRDHETNAEKYDEDAAKAKKSGDTPEFERLRKLAKQERGLADGPTGRVALSAITKIKDRAMLPTKADIPYEELFQDAMKKAERAAEAAKVKKAGGAK
jgi:hypothetical protein